MPYIVKEQREEIDGLLSGLLERQFSVGELNYIITKLLLNQVGQRGLCYDLCNSLVGVLECAKLELYRRLVSPYEDDKCKLNGDLY